jgi:hypothetical protein
VREQRLCLLCCTHLGECLYEPLIDGERERLRQLRLCICRQGIAERPVGGLDRTLDGVGQSAEVHEHSQREAGPRTREADDLLRRSALCDRTGADRHNHYRYA